MAPIRKSSERGKDKEVPIEYNRANFVSLAAILWFENSNKINKKFIVEWGREFMVN